jgi:hypothetical protein
VTITSSGPEAGLALISPTLRAQLIQDVRKEWPDLTDDQGTRGVGQTVAFLVASAQTGGRVAPSKPVDAFWHAFMLHSRAYTAFCELVAGDYLHHDPDEYPLPPAKKKELRARTTEAIAAAGFTVDVEFWPDLMADCSQCHAGCSNSPR